MATPFATPSLLAPLRVARSLVALLVCAACASRPAAVPAPTPLPAPVAAASQPPPPVVEETSVRPGANAEYLRPDMVVDEWVQRFERGGRDIFDHRMEILKATGAGPGTAIADVGAGTGLFTVVFGQAVGPQGRIYAVDIVPRFLRHIQERVVSAKLTNVTTVLGTDRSISLPAGSVDLVFLCDVYHHFEYPRSVLGSIAKALRPGGQLFVIDFHRVPGTSPGWVIEHVRAGEKVFTAEIEAAGFQRVESLNLLKENYVLRFRKSVN